MKLAGQLSIAERLVYSDLMTVHFDLKIDAENHCSVGRPQSTIQYFRPYRGFHSTAVRPFGSVCVHLWSCTDSSQAAVSSWFPIGEDECRGRRTDGPVTLHVKLGKFRFYS